MATASTTNTSARAGEIHRAESKSYSELLGLLREAATIGSVSSLLNWDQETYMPHAGAAFRAEQAALLSTLHHERITSPRIAELLDDCQRDPALKGDPVVWANLREIRRMHDKATRLPVDLVSTLARVGSQAQEAWKDARERNDFPAFAPWLDKMMSLTRRKGECLRTGDHAELYDAVLDVYEPGAKAAEIEKLFTPLRARLTDLVKELKAARSKPSDEPLNVPFDPARQHELGHIVLKAMGFDFKAGRLDVTTHPFCSGMAPGDTRLTTRYRDERFTDALYGTMHEGGHGLYEQGLPKSVRENGQLVPSEVYGTPLADSISLGIHESQSRMWENFVGRSREFWQWILPHAKRLASPALDRYGVEDLYRATNQVTPSFVRVEADETTYNLHVMLRFEIERAMIDGNIDVADLPGEWNQRFKESLGLEVPDDRKGCLQDVHWSFGLIGYFPTYALGNLYAAQMWERIVVDIPDLPERMGRGDFLPLKAWLNDKVHRHGRHYSATELNAMITGQPLSIEPLMRHLEGKLRPIYEV